MFIADFFNYLTFEKRYSPHTIVSYKKDISQFQDFLSVQHIELLNVNHHDIRAWIVSLIDSGLENKSVNRKISSLRSLYKFLVREGLIENNPVSQIKGPKTEKKIPVFLNENKVNTLLDSEIFTSDFVGQRDKLIIELLFGTGIRLAEAISLKEADVNLESKTLKVLGKRNKERILPINHSLLLLINDYLNFKKSKFNSTNSDALLVTNKGEDIYAKLIYRVVSNYLSSITTQSKKSPHVLRHSFATALLNSGADINAIKELLGHASLAATQVYTHNSIDRIKKNYKQAHPKA